MIIVKVVELDDGNDEIIKKLPFYKKSINR